MKLLSVLALFLALVPATSAHHPQTLEAFGRAMADKDFKSMRVIITDKAWEGGKGRVSFKTLEGWLRKAKQRVIEHAAGEERLKRALVMGILFFPEKEKNDLPKWVYVLMRPNGKVVNVHVRGQDHACKWKIVGLTTSFAEAEKFLGEPPHYLEERAKKKVERWIK